MARTTPAMTRRPIYNATAEATATLNRQWQHDTEAAIYATERAADTYELQPTFIVDALDWVAAADPETLNLDLKATIARAYRRSPHYATKVDDILEAGQ